MAMFTWRWIPDTPRSFNGGWRRMLKTCIMWRHGTTSAAGRDSASFRERSRTGTTNWIWIEKLRSYYAGFGPGLHSLSSPTPTEPPSSRSHRFDHSIFTICRSSNHFHVTVALLI